MKSFTIDNIIVDFVNFNDEEKIIEDMAKAAISYAEEHKEVSAAVISKITVTNEDREKSSFDVEYFDDDQPKISRIRRITGCSCIDTVS